MSLEIIPYQDKHAFQWDDFVNQESANGTIFHTRLFLSYHEEGRFEDRSILIFHNGELVAVMLLALKNGVLISHPGTSGGGLVLRSDYMKYSKANLVYSAIQDRYDRTISRMLLVEEIFCRGNIKPLLQLWQLEYSMKVEPSMYFDLQEEQLIANQRLREGMSSFIRVPNIRLLMVDNDSDYERFHEMFVANLDRHGIKPVHSLHELIKLRDLLGKKIRLYIVLDGEVVVAGVWAIQATSDSWHAQYLSRNYNYEGIGHQYALSSLISHVRGELQREGFKYFSLGSCYGGPNSEFSEGLCEFKEKLGTEMCFRYRFNLNE